MGKTLHITDLILVRVEPGLTAWKTKLHIAPAKEWSFNVILTKLVVSMNEHEISFYYLSPLIPLLIQRWSEKVDIEGTEGTVDSMNSDRGMPVL